MHVLISPTAFKGTLTPSQAARLLAARIRQQYPSASLEQLPLADGGDGTLDVLQSALGGKLIKTRVEGPLGKKITASWTILKDRTAVIEMARASGLALIRGRNRIMEATSTGTGELIRAALDRGYQKILIGVGGTACADGGAGALHALGLRFFDKNEKSLTAQPRDLAKLARVDWKTFDARVRRAKIQVLCDVTNPLLGRNGSARVFGPQKGATPSQVRALEKILQRWAAFARVHAKNFEGAGAAGALAFGLAGFAGAKLEPGTSFIMKKIDWPSSAQRADIIVTGEGRLDKTSFSGKVVGEILRQTRPRHKKVIVICGSCSLPPSEWKKKGISSVQKL